MRDPSFTPMRPASDNHGSALCKSWTAGFKQGAWSGWGKTITAVGEWASLLGPLPHLSPFTLQPTDKSFNEWTALHYMPNYSAISVEIVKVPTVNFALIKSPPVLNEKKCTPRIELNEPEIVLSMILSQTQVQPILQCISCSVHSREHHVWLMRTCTSHIQCMN